MSKFKDLMLSVLEMHEQGYDIRYLTQYFEVKQSVIEYIIEQYGAQYTSPADPEADSPE